MYSILVNIEDETDLDEFEDISGTDNFDDGDAVFDSDDSEIIEQEYSNDSGIFADIEDIDDLMDTTGDEKYDFSDTDEEISADVQDIVAIAANALSGERIDPANMIFALATAISGIAAVASSLRKKLKNRALFCINKAEEEFADQAKAGKSKYLFAVRELSKSVPFMMQPLLGKNFAEKIIETSFSDMNKFAKLQRVESALDNYRSNADMNTEDPENPYTEFICKIADENNRICQKCIFSQTKFI